MSLSDLGSLGEFIGAMAVVATLIYLALQIRQNTNSVRGANDLELSKYFAEWHSKYAHNQQLRIVWDKAARNETMNDDERATYIWAIAELFFMGEGLFRLYQRALLSDESWIPIRELLVGMFQSELVAAWWQEKRSPLSGEYRAYIDQQLAQGESDWSIPAATDIGQATGGIETPIKN